MSKITRLMIVDDELHDIGFMVQFFSEALPHCEFETFTTAEAAMARLHFDGVKGDNPQLLEDPDIIMLDLSLGAMNGFQFLKALRDDEMTRHIPVVVISGDNSSQSVDRAYEAGANAMFVKPDSLNGYRRMIESIVSYWTQTARHVAA